MMLISLVIQQRQFRCRKKRTLNITVLDLKPTEERWGWVVEVVDMELSLSSKKEAKWLFVVSGFWWATTVRTRAGGGERTCCWRT